MQIRWAEGQCSICRGVSLVLQSLIKRCLILCTDFSSAFYYFCAETVWIHRCRSSQVNVTISIVKDALSKNALLACVYISIRQLSSFRAPTLWFINLTVATCHIQYTFLSLCQFFHEKTDKTREYSKSAIFVSYKNGRRLRHRRAKH